MNDISPHDLQILRMKQVQARVGLSRSTIYELMNTRSNKHDPEFPIAITLTASGAVGFLAYEIDAWITVRSLLRRSRQS